VALPPDTGDSTLDQQPPISPPFLVVSRRSPYRRKALDPCSRMVPSESYEAKKCGSVGHQLNTLSEGQARPLFEIQAISMDSECPRSCFSKCKAISMPFECPRCRLSKWRLFQCAPDHAFQNAGHMS
jgi:hypothetical protein